MAYRYGFFVAFATSPDNTELPVLLLYSFVHRLYFFAQPLHGLFCCHSLAHNPLPQQAGSSNPKNTV
jgi:hypothetical protein